MFGSPRSSRYLRFLLILCQVILGLLIATFGTVFFMAVTNALIMGVIKAGAIPVSALLYTILIVGPHSVYTWLILLTIFILLWWFPILLAIWVLMDSRKFKKHGVKTSPLLWFLGIIFPTVVIVLPIYFVKRNVKWKTELSKTI